MIHAPCAVVRKHIGSKTGNKSSDVIREYFHMQSPTHWGNEQGLKEIPLKSQGVCWERGSVQQFKFVFWGFIVSSGILSL